MSGVRIQLDASAVEALFPEGSTQRVELTNAVAAEMSKRFFDNRMEKYVNEKIDHMQADMENSMRRVFEDFIQKRRFLSDTEKFRPEYETRLKQIAEDLCVGVIKERTEKELLAAPDLIKEKIQRMVSSDELMRKVDQALKNYSHTEIDSLAKRAIAEKLGQIAANMFGEIS